ncbi:hypothetical protein MMC07_003157 [Pseudocyphellaria aurata]|nr:hypothetical protein [Pseudocyphellaria aurata]
MSSDQVLTKALTDAWWLSIVQPKIREYNVKEAEKIDTTYADVRDIEADTTQALPERMQRMEIDPHLLSELVTIEDTLPHISERTGIGSYSVMTELTAAEEPISAGADPGSQPHDSDILDDSMDAQPSQDASTVSAAESSSQPHDSNVPDKTQPHHDASIATRRRRIRRRKAKRLAPSHDPMRESSRSSKRRCVEPRPGSF